MIEVFLTESEPSKEGLYEEIIYASLTTRGVYVKLLKGKNLKVLSLSDEGFKVANSDGLYVSLSSTSST